MVQLNGVPDGPARRHSLDRSAHDNVHLLILMLLGRRWLCEDKEGNPKIDECIPIVLDLVSSLDNLVQLRHDRSCDHGGRGSNGRDDLASDHLRVLSLALRDVVVLSSQLSGSMDVVNVEVAVIVLLKVSRVEVGTLDPNMGRVELLLQLVEDLEVILRGVVLLLLLLAWFLVNLYLEVLSRSELWNFDLLDMLLDLLLALLEGESNAAGDQIGAGLDVKEMDVVGGVEFDRVGASLGAGPEEVAFFVSVVLGEGGDQLDDLVVESVFEVKSGEFNASLIAILFL